jgi:hypothetical protein
MSSSERIRCLLAGVLSFASLVPTAHAIEAITIDTARIEGLGLDARGVNLRLEAGGDAPGAELTIEELTLPAPIGRIRSVRAHCDALRIVGDSYDCDGGSAQLRADRRSRRRAAPRRMRSSCGAASATTRRRARSTSI